MGLQIYKLVEIPSSKCRELQSNAYCSPEFVKGVSCPRMTAREKQTSQKVLCLIIRLHASEGEAQSESKYVASRKNHS